MVVTFPNRRYAILAATTLITLWLWVDLRRLYTLPSVFISTLTKNHGKVYDVFDFAPVDSEPMRTLCAATQWNQDLIFTCDQSVGGIGNIRNSILNCIRYTISAGASLVIPSIVIRNTSDISHIRTGVTTDFSYMFDTQHLLDSLQLSCPSLHILQRSEIEEMKIDREVGELLPESLAGKVPATGLVEPTAWREQFYIWLQQYPKFTGPTVVDLQRSYLQYPIYSDGEDFALSFGSILKFRSDVRVLATKTLQSLSDTYHLNLDLSQAILPNAFFGVHLRTERDAVEGWPAPDWVYSRFETQSQKYLEQAPRSNSSIIYVASGDLNEVTKLAFNATSAPNNYIVTSKTDLLRGEDLEELHALKWDQQGLVDFLVMSKASDFAGIGHSSFAWNVALKRHVYARQTRHLDGATDVE